MKALLESALTDHEREGEAALGGDLATFREDGGIDDF